MEEEEEERQQQIPSEPKLDHLLNELDAILQSDPLINEVGFVHPTQFAILQSNQEDISDNKVSDVCDSSFWSCDHKLGISTEVILPLYKAARSSFMAAIKEYRVVCDSADNKDLSFIECDVMKYSRALLLVSYDFGTAWNARKSVVSSKSPLSTYLDELQFSALVLSHAPKCEHAWSHRRWVIKSISGRCPILQDILGKESELVEKIAEKSKMNYRAWNHRCWLVSYMTTERAFYELKKSRNWAGLHVADNSCFHYRRRLMLRILEGSSEKPENTPSDHTDVDIHQLWKDELDWNERLIKLYAGREGLWLHRRFLSLTLMTRLLTIYTNDDVASFVNHEFGLLRSCSTVEDSQFEDYQGQALYSATYMLWLAKQIPEVYRTEFLSKVRAENLKTMLIEVCPEKSFLWDYLL